MTTTTMRRCTGSVRFGIEAHEASIDEFPKQPSRKDGLGMMCTVHWKAYVKCLRETRGAVPAKEMAKPAATATTKRERQRTPTVHLPDPKVIEAVALIAAVDRLPGPEHIKRVGDDDVQAALETVNGHGLGRETPLGEASDSDAEEPDIG